MTPTRREALTRIASFGALAAGLGGTGAWLHGAARHSNNPTDVLPNFQVERASVYADLGVGVGGGPRENTRAAIDALGGMTQFISAGDRVMIKPNVAWKRIPEQAATTNPDVIAELVTMCRDAGAREVVVFDCPCDPGAATFRSSGIQAAVEAAGGQIAFPGKTDFTKVAFGGSLIKHWTVWNELPKFDKIINAAIAKHHVQSRATCGMKNWYGILGGDRGLLHQNIHGSIVDLAGAIRPTLTVLDAQRVLMRNGPTGGSLGDVKLTKSVAAGLDPVAIDAWGIEQLEQRPDDIPFIAQAEARGLGTRNWRSLKHKEVQVG
jgi:uncharacterized protein (DUF362 family)